MLREQHRLRIFENRVLKKIVGLKREDVTGEWKKLYNEELHELQSSPNNIWVSKYRRMKWAGHVSCVGQKGNVRRVSGKNLKGRDH